jgi:prepilin-type N-terminal cleavage/methylation domain-containing protein
MRPNHVHATAGFADGIEARAARQGRRDCGFTLLEMVVTIIVIGVLAMAVVPVMKSGIAAYEVTTTGLETLSILRYATERMAREVREVRRNPGSPANYDIATMTASNLSFTKRDGNRVTLTAAPPSATLTYQTPAVSGLLTDQVGSLAFRYYEIDGVTQTVSTSAVAFIEVDLTLTDGSAALRSRTRVALRNQQ